METFLRSILLGKEKGGCSFVLSIPHVEWSFNRGWCWQKGDGKGFRRIFRGGRGIPFGLSVFPEIMDIKGYETCQ